MLAGTCVTTVNGEYTPDAVSNGCETYAMLIAFNAVMVSDGVKAYSHVNVALAPGPSVGYRTMRLRPSSALAGEALEYPIHSVFVQADADWSF